MRGPQRGQQRREVRSGDGPLMEMEVIQTNKVSKTHKGGKTMSWSVIVVVGDGKGRVGVGLGKARGVPDAIRKAEEVAKKSMMTVPMIGQTITHEVKAKYGTAQVLLRPASPGTGVKAGGAVRKCLELAGVHNVLAKILGSRNDVNVAYATMEAFKQLQHPEALAESRGIPVDELVPWLAKARKEEQDAAITS
ncbi:MAG: 30S ribosomal protein S5 [Fimbriimonadaceae bacterium]